MGRFLTTDPDGGSARSGNPGSWNRYAYVAGDPVNRVDRTGLDEGDFAVVDGLDDCNSDFCDSAYFGFGDGSGGGSTGGGDYCSLNPDDPDCFDPPPYVPPPPVPTPPPPPDCTINISYRPVIVAGVNTGKNHIIITTIVGGVQTVYEGEPTNPTAALPKGGCVPTGGTACPTNSTLAGVTTPNGSKGLGTPYQSIMGGTDICADAAIIASTNTTYNSHQLLYTDNGAPNSNSYAYTLLYYSGLLPDVGLPPPNTPGWGYNIITNPNSYPSKP
jgi:hypothetical protein